MTDMRSLVQLTLLRVRVMLREPEMVFWVFAFPILLAVGIGLAFADPAPERLEVAVVEGPDAPRHAQALEGRDDLRVRILTEPEAVDALRRGEVAAVVRSRGGGVARVDTASSSMDSASSSMGTASSSRNASSSMDASSSPMGGGTPGEEGVGGGGVDAGWGAGAASGSTARSVEIQVDLARAEGRMARVLVDQALQEGAGALRPVTVAVREVEQRGQRYIDWLIPGIIGFNLMSTGLWGVGFYITQSRQNRQLKRLVATPMPRGHFLLAQILARFFFLVVEVPVLLLLAWWLFDVRLEGSVLALTTVVFLGAACFSGLGLLVSARVRTSEAVSGLINVLVMPMVVLSGVFFSPSRFPDAAQPLIALLPLTALNDALRHVYNDGLPLHQAGTELAIVIGWTVVSFAVALRIFRWQ